MYFSISLKIFWNSFFSYLKSSEEQLMATLRIIGVKGKFLLNYSNFDLK
jgi:hypothetical protein